jgi:hypothetical protein
MHVDASTGHEKTGAIYYIDSSGGLRILYGRQGTYGTFPRPGVLLDRVRVDATGTIYCMLIAYFALSVSHL